MYAGGADANNIFQGCLYHYDGTGWENVSFAGLPIVFDIWGSAGDDVYLVGLAGRWHYNGTAWTRISTAVGESVWGFSAHDVFVGHTDIRRYQGAGWNAMAFPDGLTSVQIRGLWGLNASEMYAVGTGSTILRYDGNQNGQWEYFRSGLEGTNYDLYDVWASSSEDIFAGGWNCIFHYDGIFWTRFAISLPKDDWIHRIWGTGPDDVYAVAYENSSILHYDGISWSVINSAPSNPSQLSTAGMYASNTISELPSALKLKAICGISSDSIYFAGDEGIVVHYTPDIAECEDDSDCANGYLCVDSECVPIPDDPPALTSGPFVADGNWPMVSASQSSPTYMSQNYSLLWTFSDDYASCPEGACTHTAEYSVAGSGTWEPLTVESNAEAGYAYVELPVTTELSNATTYAFRYSVTDCASQTTQSQTYYFRVATSDVPPVITSGPFVAAGTWPLLPTSVVKSPCA